MIKTLRPKQKRVCAVSGQWVLVWQCFARDPQMDLASFQWLRLHF